MKFLISIVISASLLFSLTACANLSGNQSKPKTTTNQGTDSSKSSTVNENEESGESFYGQWQINKVIAYGPVGTYSSDDIKTLTGKKLTFSINRATCFRDKIEDMNNTVTNPVYKKKVIAKNDFSTDYRVTLDQLGINGESITEVDAAGPNGNCVNFFITPDHNKLILYGGGTYFELVKILE